MPYLLLSFLIGFIAGLRALTAPALVSWAVRTGLLPMVDSRFAFLGFVWTPWILSACALGELVNDKLPGTPSRKAPTQFLLRILTGAASGMVLALPSASPFEGLLAGAFGAIAGTLAGAWARVTLGAAVGGKDIPVALMEDVVAIGGGLWIVSQTR